MPNKDLTNSKLDSFLSTLAKTPVVAESTRSRLIFSLDATASRAATWDRACQLQSEMFDQTSQLGGLSIQLSYYRGFKQFYTSPWHNQTQSLLDEMTAVSCLGGHTQIAKLLNHALKENLISRVRALVFIGDAIEENPDELCHLAGKLGLMKVPVFTFHEGKDAAAESIFRQIATLSGGAYVPFDLNSASQLRSLLTAVAVYAAGGSKALKALEKTTDLTLLTQQIKD